MNIPRYYMLMLLLLALTAHALPEEIAVDVPVQVVDGIDVSDHQKMIDWDATARDKRVKFVYIKATEGATYQSKVYRYNLENARRVGIKVGSYHFLRTGSRIRDQFDNFTRVVKKHEQDLLPLIDIEVRQGWTNQQVRDSVKLFADLVEEYYGCRPMIYTSSHFYNKILGRSFADYPLFIARYATNAPSLESGDWILWQYSEKGRIAGIDAAVDLSCFNKGRGVQDILIKNNRMGSRRRNNSDAVDNKDKPSTVKVKEAPTMSKQQEKELKKQQEKERKARERAEKLRQEELKKEAERNRKEQEHQRKLQEELKKKQEKEEKARQEKLKKEQEAEAKRLAKEKRQAGVEQRLKQQQAEQQKAKQEDKNKLQQQKQNAAQTRQGQTTPTNIRQSTRTRKTNKSSADND